MRDYLSPSGVWCECGSWDQVLHGPIYGETDVCRTRSAGCLLVTIALHGSPMFRRQPQVTDACVSQPALDWSQQFVRTSQLLSTVQEKSTSTPAMCRSVQLQSEDDYARIHEPNNNITRNKSNASLEALQYRQDMFLIAHYHNRKTSLLVHVVQKITIIRLRAQKIGKSAVWNLILCSDAIWRQWVKFEHGCTTINHPL